MKIFHEIIWKSLQKFKNFSRHSFRDSFKNTFTIPPEILTENPLWNFVRDSSRIFFFSEYFIMNPHMNSTKGFRGRVQLFLEFLQEFYGILSHNLSEIRLKMFPGISTGIRWPIYSKILLRIPLKILPWIPSKTYSGILLEISLKTPSVT